MDGWYSLTLLCFFLCRQRLQAMPCQWELGSEGELLHVQGDPSPGGREGLCVCVCACVRACVRVCVCVLFYVLCVHLCLFVLVDLFYHV